MSILSRLLSLEPIDENIVQAIVVSVALPAAKIDFAVLGADLAEAKWSSLRLQGPSSPRKQTLTQRKRSAATVRTHAAKLFEALGPAVEDDLLPLNRAILNWNFPLMIPDREQGEFHESKQVHGGADRFRFEAG